MDEVLTRPLFRDAYLQTVKKNTSDGILSVYKFQTGGEVFSEGEKFALLAAPVISSLLEGTVAPGENKLSAFFKSAGRGIGKIPEIGLKIREIESKKKVVDKVEIGQATAQEKIQQLGRRADDNVIVKRVNGVIDSIVSQPSEKFVKDRSERENVLNDIGKIKNLYNKLGEPSGPVEGNLNKFSAFLGLDQNISELMALQENVNKNYIQALRGAQVGPKEEGTFANILPSITDAPSVYKAKLKALEEGMRDLNSRINNEGIVSNPGKYDFSKIEKILNTQIGEFQKNAPTYKLSPEGGLIKVK
jgi:hypothetical protein